MLSLPFEVLRRRAGLPSLLLLLLAVAGCGGGGGGGDSGNPPGQPSPSPNSLSGIAMLGPVANADVAIIGTSGVLGTGQTGTDGRFGPIEYPGSYSGPLRIEVSGNGGSTWTCDFRPGCPNGGSIQPAGATIDFDGTLEAVLPSAANGQFVSVSLLSDMVSKRVDVLGGLDAANVDSASADIANLLRTILAEAISSSGIQVPEDFSTAELFDVGQPPPPGRDDDALRTVLSLLNSSLVGLSLPTQTTGEFIDAISQMVAEQPDLPVSQPDFADPSLESVLTVFFVQVIDISQSSDFDLIVALDQLLSPGNVESLYWALLDQYVSLPSLVVVRGAFEYSLLVDDAALQDPITHSLEVITNTGAPLGLQDYGARVFYTEPGTPWLSAAPELVNGVPHIRLDFDRAHLATLDNGIYEVFVETYSQTGDYARDSMPVVLHLQVIGKQINAGGDFDAEERATVALDGFTNSPADVQSVNWTQLDGPTVAIDNPNIFVPNVTLPSLETSQAVTLRLDVEFTTGESRSDSVTITIVAFPNIADQDLADAALQQCIDHAAAAGNFIETPEITTLTCSGVSDLSGLDVFTGLVRLELPGNSLDSLENLLALESLDYLDVSGTVGLPCSEIDALGERLEEGVDLIVDDLCTGAVDIDLGAAGFDAALDEARGQIYVSVPDRNEVAVISTTDLRVVDRILLSGVPRGIDLSIDGTRLFAALHGSTSVAVIDIDQRTVSTIPLGDSTGHPSTWDVVEGAPNRLFVSASPGSGGLAHIAQVQLDQGNIVSRAANETFMRARPTFARSPNHDFVYVGTGFSPNSLYKLSLLDPDAGIVLEDDHGSVGGTDNLVLNAAGTRIALSSGQVLRTGSFIEEGSVTPGYSAAGTASNTLYVAVSGGQIEAFDFTTLEALDTTQTGCDNGATSRLHAYDGDESFMLLQGATACLYTQMSRTAPVDPYAALRFPDLGFEECVIDAATANGFTQPEDFVVLDCSATTRNILSIEGIERLVNLEQLNLSNSGLFDLSPLAALPALQSLVVRNASIGDLAPLFDLGTLSSVDLTGNPAVNCAELDQLVSSGVAVQADECTETVRVELGGIGADLAFDSAGDRAFVSVPSLQRILEIDLAGATIAQEFDVGGQARGIDLSEDNQTLYAALYQLGDLAVVDIVNGGMPEIIDISVQLDDDRTWDVAEVSANRIVVSSNPGSNGFAYIVEVRRDLGNAATRVASQTIIRAEPIFAVSPDGLSVYVGSGFSPNSLYKLDASQPSLPIVLEDDHGEVSGTNSLALSPDGSRIYLRSGQVLDTGSFTQVAQFPLGRSTVSSDGTTLLVGDTEADAARLYDTATTGQVGTRSWGCDLATLTALYEYGNGVLALGDDLVCYSRTVSYP